MIRKLRIKFVCIFLSITMLMTGGILGVVIHFTGASMEMQSVTMLHSLAREPLRQRNPEKFSGEVRLPYFTLQISSRGELIATGGGYFDLSDREYLSGIVSAVLETGEDTGKLKDYSLRFLVEKTPMGYLIVFSDTSAESATLRNLIYGCAGIFLSAGVLFLGVSILLSKWAIKPVETAWEQQRQFVADASHEFKTPLSVIMANAELVSSEETGEEDRKKFSRNILTMSYQMRALVENLLEMARVDNGSVTLHFEELDFSELVRDAVMSFQPFYEEAGMTLSWHLEEPLFLRGSEHSLFQLLDVLLDNALKYSEPQGEVSVCLKKSGRSCILTVSNPGPALSADELKNIFKRFYRVDKARSMNGSYGLGLSIAESVVEAHRGRIRAESSRGHNTFTVQLPISGAGGHGISRKRPEIPKLEAPES